MIRFYLDLDAASENVKIGCQNSTVYRPVQNSRTEEVLVK